MDLAAFEDANVAAALRRLEAGCSDYCDRVALLVSTGAAVGALVCDVYNPTLKVSAAAAPLAPRRAAYEAELGRWKAVRPYAAAAALLGPLIAPELAYLRLQAAKLGRAAALLRPPRSRSRPRMLALVSQMLRAFSLIVYYVQLTVAYELAARATCRARFSFEAQLDGDLSIRRGDVITVLSQDGEWWLGELGGRVGRFPSNYVG
jgi:hypothetical protein